jgi:hypothetical protein
MRTVNYAGGEVTADRSVYQRINRSQLRAATQSVTAIGRNSDIFKSPFSGMQLLS